MLTVRTVRNCALRHSPECPKLWPSLSTTLDPEIRHCQVCDQDVFFCATREETVQRGREGRLVARDEPARSELPAIRLGGPRIEPTPSQEAAFRAHAQERGITILLNGRLTAESRDCPSCAYPVPSFRKSCYVCGYNLGRG
jgi:hypothetical protein